MSRNERKRVKGESDYSRMVDLLVQASLPYSMPPLEHTGGGLLTPCLIVEVAPAHNAKHPLMRNPHHGEKLTYFHRVLYHRLYGGAPNQAIKITQLCGQPRCCAPDHLQPVMCEALKTFTKRLNASLKAHPPIPLPDPQKQARIKKDRKSDKCDKLKDADADTDHDPVCIN